MNRLSLMSVIFTPLFFLTCVVVPLTVSHSAFGAVPDSSTQDSSAQAAPTAAESPADASKGTTALSRSNTSTNSSTNSSAKSIGSLKTKKSTEVNFDDVLVQGKYHFSDEAVTTVEQDKILDALLGVRTDFKDRLRKSAARH